MPPACVPDEAGRCSICGDEGVVGEVVEVSADAATGLVRLHGDGAAGGGAVRETEVALDLVHAPRPGDRVVVHMGFAIAKVRGSAPASAAGPPEGDVPGAGAPTPHGDRSSGGGGPEGSGAAGRDGR